MNIVIDSRIKRRILGNVPFVVAGAFLIIYISFGVVYFQKQSEFQSLGSQILSQRAILQKLPPDIEKLNSQLAEAKAEYEMSLIVIPDPGQSIDIYGALVDVGRNSNAEVMSIDASPPITITAGNETVLPYSLVVQGSQSDILDFISRLMRAGELLQGLELKNINIKNGALPGDLATLNLELYVHTWSGVNK